LDPTRKIDDRTLVNLRMSYEYRQEQDNKTMEVMSQARDARVFGGQGELRMCGQCRTVPFENKACHNHSDQNRWKEHEATTRRRPNECPNCGWYNSDWYQWPEFDGIYGPH